METLLIIDDNASIRRLLKLTVGRETYRVLEAGNTDEALELFEAESPAVMLVDVMLPGRMDGNEFCRHVKSTDAGRNCFVIMVSAKGLETDIESSRAAGADAYLIKPFSPAGLRRLLKDERHRDPASRGFIIYQE